MQNKEWMSINRYRNFPFRDTLFSPEWILDLTIQVPTSFILPLYVTNYNIKNGAFCIRISDKNDKYVGHFIYIGKVDFIKMNPHADGCFGILVPGDSIEIDANESVSEDVKVEIELACIKLYRTGKIRVVITPDGKESNGDVRLVENDILEYSVNNGLTTIDNGQPFPAVCPGRTPIMKINNATPNLEGIIEIRSLNTGVVPEVIDSNRIVVSSPYSITDFDKRSLTGPQGKPGVEGDTGEPGEDGQLICESMDIDTYNGVLYNSQKSFAIYDDFHSVSGGISSDGKSHVLTYGDESGKILEINSAVPGAYEYCHIWEPKLYGDPPVEIHRGYISGFAGVKNDQVYMISLDGSYEYKSFGTPIGWKYISKKIGNRYYVANSTSVYEYDWDSNFAYSIAEGVGIINGIKYFKGTLYILCGSGFIRKLSIDESESVPLETIDIFIGDSETNIEDIYSNNDITLAVADSGAIVKVNRADAQIVFDVGNPLYCIDGLDKNVFQYDHPIYMAGNFGLFYKYDIYTGALERIGMPPIKNWRSLRAVTNTEIFLYS